MNPVLRKFLFRFLAICFVIIVPFLVFLVLGFDLDLRQKKLVNSLDVNVETWPTGAKVSNFNQELELATPTNFKVPAGTFLDLSVAKDGFLPERVGVYGPSDQNTNVRLSNWWLLPTKSQNIASFNVAKNQASGQQPKENLQILPQVILWTESQSSSQVSAISPNNTTSSELTSNFQNNSFLNSSADENSILPNQPLPGIQSSSTSGLASSTGESNLSLSSQSLAISGSSQPILPNNSQENLSISSPFSEPPAKHQSDSETKENLFVQKYSLNGLIGSKQLVTGLNRPFNISQNQKSWQPIGVNSFWHQKDSWLLFENEQKWYLQDLTDLPLQNLVRLSNWQFLALDQQKTLWLWDLETKPISATSNSLLPSFDSSSNSSSDSPSQNQIEIATNVKAKFRRQFLDSQISQIATDNQNIWLWSSARIYRLSTGKIDNWQPQFFSQNLALLQTCCYLKTQSFLQGNLFLFDRQLWFLPDFDKTKWLKLADNVVSFESFEEVVFWQDSNGFLQTYNFITKNSKYLGQIENQALNLEKPGDNFNMPTLYYDASWRRLLIYNQNQAWTVWFDKFNPNAVNLLYTPALWLTDLQCLPQIQDRLQFCLDESGLKSYGNFNFF